MPSNLRSLRRKCDEAHLGRLAVEVAVEVEQVGLEQRVVGVLVERRPAAEGDGARVHARRRAARTSRRRSRRRAGTRRSAPRRWRWGTRAAGPAGRRATTMPRTSCGRPSMRGRRARRRRRRAPGGWRWTTGSSSPSAPQRRAAAGSTSKPHSLARARRSRRDVAPALVAEVEVLADHDAPGAPRRRRGPRSRSPRRLLASAPRRRARTTVRVEPGGGEQLELLLEVGEQLGRRLRPHDLAGWRSKVTTALRAPRSAAAAAAPRRSRPGGRGARRRRRRW